ncbi:MAG: acyltransferase family protein [Chthoniobacterales bacterium]
MATVAMKKDLPILDLARGAAACWVMLAHLTLIGGRPIVGLSQGRLGVEVFIFISGFLMTLILKDDVALDGVGGFYLRRFFRIAPSFYFALILYAGLRPFFTSGLESAEAIFHTPFLIPDLHKAVTWRTLLWDFSFLHGLLPGEATRIFGPAWSLSLEMQFYAVAPFAVWFLRQRPAFTLVSLFAVNYAGNFLFGVYGHLGLLAQFPYPSFLPNRIFLFALGGAYCLYLFQRRPKDLVIFVVSALASLPLIGWKSWIVCLGLIGLIQLAVSVPGPGKILNRVARSKASHLLAEWSYGIYLYHMLALGLGGLFLPRWTRSFAPGLLWSIYALTVIASTVIFAAVLHHFYERPARAFGRTLGRKRSSVGESAVAVSTP